MKKLLLTKGIFDSIAEALTAYNLAAIEYHGQFVKLNMLEHE